MEKSEFVSQRLNPLTVDRKLKTTKRLIHELLERMCHIPEAEGHADKLVKDKWSGDGHLGHVCQVPQECDGMPE